MEDKTRNEVDGLQETHKPNESCVKNFMGINNTLGNLQDLVQSNKEVTNEKFEVINKKVDSFEMFLDKTNSILTKFEMIIQQQSSWIEKKDIRDEKRDQILSDISQTLKSVSEKQNIITEKQDKQDKKVNELRGEFFDLKEKGQISYNDVFKYVFFTAVGVLVTVGIYKFLGL